MGQNIKPEQTWVQAASLAADGNDQPALTRLREKRCAPPLYASTASFIDTTTLAPESARIYNRRRDEPDGVGGGGRAPISNDTCPPVVVLL